MLGAFEKLPLEKQEKILESAADVFAHEGYHYASIANICKKAEISNGALYKYFKNKEQLFLAVLGQGVRLVETELYQKYTTDSSLYDGIKQLFQGLTIFSQNQLSHLKIYSDLGSSSMNRFAAEASEQYRNSTSQYTLRMVQRGKQHGEVRQDIPDEVAACLIDNYITLYAYSLVSEYHYNRFDAFDPDIDRQNGTRVAWMVSAIRSVLY